MPADTAARSPSAPRLTPKEILDRLNPPQREAVSHLSGPLLILAGAGSGKTRVLAHRVAYLIATSYKPWQIVAVTFTNKAANEMRQRIAGLIGEEGAREATIGTFHAICARILRRDGEAIGLTRSFTIYDRADQMALVKTVLKNLDLDEKRFGPAGMLAWIGQRKDELADVATASKQAANYYDETAARVYAAYQRQLAEDDAVDFDDLLMRVVFLFEQHPEVLARYQQRWQQILVDEYQDTNRAQYLICRQLAAKHKNLAVVGDDDQSIYSWRGADLRNILDFEADYPDAKVVKLEQNYRSTQTILDAAHAVVSRNEGRKDKKLWTDRGTGTQITLFDAYNEYEEAEFVARQVEKLVGGARRGGMSALLTSRADDEDGSLRYGDIAVGYRINAQSRVLEESLMRFGIPYQLVGGVRFYERREVKDALGYVRLARNPADRVALLRIINVPARGIGAKTVEELNAWAESRGTSPLGGGAGRRREPEPGDALARPARRLRRAHAGADGDGRRPSHRRAIFDAALERSGLQEAIQDGTDDGEERWANLMELRNHAAEFDEIARARGPRAIPGGGRARQRPGRDGGRPRPGDAHHAPRRKGPGVPGRLHGRPGGGAAAAPPRAGGRARARGGAAPRLRGHDPRQGPAVPRPRAPSVHLRRRRPGRCRRASWPSCRRSCWPRSARRRRSAAGAAIGRAGPMTTARGSRPATARRSGAGSTSHCARSTCPTSPPRARSAASWTPHGPRGGDLLRGRERRPGLGHVLRARAPVTRSAPRRSRRGRPATASSTVASATGSSSAAGS